MKLSCSHGSPDCKCLLFNIYFLILEKHLGGLRLYFREIRVPSTLNCFDRSLPENREYDVLYKLKSFHRVIAAGKIFRETTN